MLKKENLFPTIKILIFPLWLWHATEPYISSSNKISVSFNFIQETLKPIEKGHNG